MLKRGLHRLVCVYTCQNATLLEIACGGSIMICIYKAETVAVTEIANKNVSIESFQQLFILGI